MVDGDVATWVLLHGTPLDPLVWRDVGSRLARHGKVLVPDANPRHGDPTPQHNIAARVAETLGNGPQHLHVVGHSFGGQVALELAVILQLRVSSLTLICSRITAFPPFAASAESLKRGDPVDVEAGIARWFTPAEIDEDDGGVVQYARRRLTNPNRALWSQALAAISTYDGSAKAPMVTAPTTSIAAEGDAVSTPQAVAATAQMFPAGRFQLLPGAMHMSPFVHPENLAARLLVAATQSAATN